MSNKKGSTVKSFSIEAALRAVLAADEAAKIANRKSNAEMVKDLLGEDVTVVYNGKPTYDLNASLILRQGLGAPEVRILKALHAEKLKYFDLMKSTDDSALLKQYAKEIESIEFQMQEAWHFEKDASKHGWDRVPKCVCATSPNIHYSEQQGRYIDAGCPVHGY